MVSHNLCKEHLIKCGDIQNTTLTLDKTEHFYIWNISMRRHMQKS